MNKIIVEPLASHTNCIYMEKEPYDGYFLYSDKNYTYDS